MVDVLDELLEDYVTVDVLADEAIREGVKEYGQWPTIPQLYVRGKLVGGFDTALEEVKKRLDERVRERVEVRVARTPRHHQDVPDLPQEREDAARKAAGALLSALLPARERIVVELAASGERILALGPVTET